MNRMPTRTTREVWHALFSALAGDSRAARFRALDETASLLAESQYARMGRLSYSPEPIPTDRIHQLLIDALGSESWENRVRTLEAVQIVGLDQELLDAVYACLDHEHWLVRLMAVRLLGERLGEKFAERARLILSNDSDELVRDLARSVTERYTVASGAPADPTAD
jgi:HEAT repeat protein